MSASFYASPAIGATTTVAVFFHEIPHEVGDFALLVQSGFSKRAAMGAQFVTALGALMGTLMGIAIHEFGGGVDGHRSLHMTGGLLGTSLTWYVFQTFPFLLFFLPFSILSNSPPITKKGRHAAALHSRHLPLRGTVAVIPELLETGPHKAAELRKAVMQFAAILAGAAIMLFYLVALVEGRSWPTLGSWVDRWHWEGRRY